MNRALEDSCPAQKQMYDARSEGALGVGLKITDVLSFGRSQCRLTCKKRKRERENKHEQVVFSEANLLTMTELERRRREERERTEAAWTESKKRTILWRDKNLRASAEKRKCQI